MHFLHEFVAWVFLTTVVVHVYLSGHGRAEDDISLSSETDKLLVSCRFVKSGIDNDRATL